MHQESASMILTQFSFHVQYPIPVFEASMAVSFSMDPQNVFFFGWFLLKPSQKGQMTDPNGFLPRSVLPGRSLRRRWLRFQLLT